MTLPDAMRGVSYLILRRCYVQTNDMLRQRPTGRARVEKACTRPAAICGSNCRAMSASTIIEREMILLQALCEPIAQA